MFEKLVLREDLLGIGVTVKLGIEGVGGGWDKGGICEGVHRLQAGGFNIIIVNSKLRVLCSQASTCPVSEACPSKT